MTLTYPEMNAKIVDLLRWNKENPVVLYAAARIEELETETERLRDRAQRAEAKTANLRGALQAALLPLERAADALVPEARVEEAAALVDEAIEAVREGLEDNDCLMPCDGCEAVLTHGEDCPLAIREELE